jgi:hypothetical protein
VAGHAPKVGCTPAIATRVSKSANQLSPRWRSSPEIQNLLDHHILGAYRALQLIGKKIAFAQSFDDERCPPPETGRLLSYAMVVVDPSIALTRGNQDHTARNHQDTQPIVRTELLAKEGNAAERDENDAELVDGRDTRCITKLECTEVAEP